MTTNAGLRFSILIPTRNGIHYLKYAVGSVLTQSSNAFELVVSDNHSTDGTAEYLATITDVRVRCVKPPSLLSMSDHFEFILSQAKGEWVTALGDDDGLLPFFFDWLHRLDIDALGVDALVFRRAYYFWDGCEELYGSQVVAYHPSPKRRLRGNRLALFLCLTSIIDYMHLPQLYTTGLVRRAYIDKIKALAGGRFFHGRTPDACSAVALALNAPQHYRLEQPLFWTGTSPKSTGFSGSSETQKTRINEFDVLNQKAATKETDIIPAAIRGLFDLSVIFYEALLANPATSPIWSSRIARDCLLAGLIIKDRNNLAIINTAYREHLLPYELHAAVAAVKILTVALRWTGYWASTSEAAASVYSEQRNIYPTMTEASAHVRAAESR